MRDLEAELIEARRKILEQEFSLEFLLRLLLKKGIISRLEMSLPESVTPDIAFRTDASFMEERENLLNWLREIKRD